MKTRFGTWGKTVQSSNRHRWRIVGSHNRWSVARLSWRLWSLRRWVVQLAWWRVAVCSVFVSLQFIILLLWQKDSKILEYLLAVFCDANLEVAYSKLGVMTLNVWDLCSMITYFNIIFWPVVTGFDLDESAGLECWFPHLLLVSSRTWLSGAVFHAVRLITFILCGIEVLFQSLNVFLCFQIVFIFY